MANYTPLEFAKAIKQNLYAKMPLESSIDYEKKHSKRVGRMRDIALGDNNVVPLLNKGYFFELGNTIAEVNTPQYHILEDAQVIHKKGQGTKTSRGSQAKVLPSKRDYGKWTKTIVVDKNGEVSGVRWSQEYRKNNRGSRSKIIEKDGVKMLKKEVKTVYVNKHYHYIEKILERDIDQIASQYGLKRKSKGGDHNLSEIQDQILQNEQNKY